MFFVNHDFHSVLRIVVWTQEKVPVGHYNSSKHDLAIFNTESFC